MEANLVFILRVLMARYLFIFAIIYSVSILFGKEPLYDPDIGWHIQAGYQIRELGYIPLHDLWSFSADQRWYNLSWLFDVVVSYADQLFGLKSLNLFTYFWFALLGVLVFRKLDTFKISHDTKMVTLTLTMLVLFEMWFLRPQIFTYFLLMGLIELLAKHSKTRMALIFLLTLFWANIHGSFLIVFITIGAFGVEAILKKNYERIKQLILTGFISFLATFCTPLGYEIYIAVLRTLDSNMTRYITEWRPFTFGIYYGFSLMIAVLLLISNANIKISIANRVLAFFWLFYSLASIRSFGYFAIAALPYLSSVIDKNIFKSTYEIKLNAKLKSTLAAVLLISSLGIYQFKNIEHSTVYPAAKWLAENAKGKNVFNEYNFGGFLIYYGKGQLKHFIDGRAGTAFSEDLLLDYLSVLNQESGWQKRITKYNFEYAMIYKDMLKLHEVFEFFNTWEKVFQENDVLVLKNPKVANSL